MEKVAIVHYDEIALKGANRKIFEQALVSNLVRKIKRAELPVVVENTWGRIVIRAKQHEEWGSEHDTAVSMMLARTPGVTVFGLGYAVDADNDAVIRAIDEVMKTQVGAFRTFRVTTTRVDKKYPGSSQDLDRMFGAHIFQEICNGEKNVDLNNPDVNVRVEILQTGAYVYIKQEGISGLPVGSTGKAVALLSGGFDSPVAAYMCAQRGVEPLLMHFHAYPQTSKAAIEKVEDLARVLKDICGSVTLAMVPLLDAQKEIALTAPEKLRVVLYRRLMMRVAEKWALDTNAKALITGDSVGQVASQTLENISAIERAVDMPILRPLCGMNKRDIVNMSRTIGTHDISVIRADDTCTVFMPKKPETKARLDQVLRAEESYDSDKLVDDMLARIEIQKL